MMSKIINLIKSNKGSTLLMVVTIFSVLSILTIPALFTGMSNTKQAAYQANNMQAYYIAYSGVEAAYAALFTDTSKRDLLGEFKSGSIKSLGPEEITIGGNGEKAEVRVDITESGKTILITSKGITGNGKETKTLQMSFPINYPELKKWIEK